MNLRAHILAFLLVFGLTPLLLAVGINLPLVLDRTALFYQRAYLQNLRADFRDLDQHLASRHEMIRLLAKLPDPGLILGEQGGAPGSEPADPDQVDLARARYTGWINQILADQRDIIQVLFVAADGQVRFWLERDVRSQEWRPTAEPPQAPSRDFLAAGLGLEPGAVMVSRIRVDPSSGAEDPRRLITLSLVSRIGGVEAGKAGGAVVLAIDVGGLAQFYRDTVWVNQDGSYLRPGQPSGGSPTAFTDFPGLEEIFRQGNLALWKGPQARQLLWVPMFLTEEGLSIWVGRAVDPSPMDEFRNALMLRVLSIILALVVVVMILARWIAARAEQFGKELTGGIGQILREGAPVRFHWRRPREIRELGDQLTALAQTHAEHLRSAREHTRELERSNRYKSEFLANVSHELRTPLNSILLLSKMLAADTSGLSAGQRRQARVIHEAGADLRTLIDDILDISRIEAGHVAVHLEWVDLGPVLQELMELVGPLLADKPVRLELRIDPAAPGRIHTDREKLRQILKNFLSNAIKFTDQGHITLSLEARPDAGRPLALSVTDTGIGIPEDKQEIIFEAFQQADGSTRRRYGGTGLGLSISRELASVLGARIEVHSQPGSGARFDLLLPLSARSEPPMDQQPASPSGTQMVEASSSPSTLAEESLGAEGVGAGPWVLIIDRDVRSLVHLAGLINARGYGVQTAADLDEALETLQEEREDCALVLLAILVSAAKTCDTIASLLKQHQNGGRGPRVAVVGDPVTESILAACLSAGAVAFLTKPVETEALYQLLPDLSVRSLDHQAQGPVRLTEAPIQTP
jgi:signal transduction histidine kinase/CheY-like chemotaxis protein